VASGRRALDSDTLLGMDLWLSTRKASQQLLFNVVRKLKTDWVVTLGKLLADIARISPG
jgi:hypothetical protein